MYCVFIIAVVILHEGAQWTLRWIGTLDRVPEKFGSDVFVKFFLGLIELKIQKSKR
jgi:hypothetical protein